TLVKKYNVNFVLNYQRRFFDLFEKARTMVQDGTLGTIQQVSCYYSNGLQNNGGHVLDALEFLLNDEIIFAQGQFAPRQWAHPIGDYCVDGILTTKKGTHLTLQSVDQSQWGINDIRILGTKGQLLLTDFGYTLELTPVAASLFAAVPQLAMAKTKRTHTKESMVAGA